MDYYKKKKRKNIILLIIFFILFVFIILIFIFYRLKSNRIVNNDKDNTINQTTEYNFEFYQNFDKSFGCNYYRKSDQYYYMSTDQSNSFINLMPTVDKYSFKALDSLYAKDQFTVFYKGLVMNGVDVNSFTPIYSNSFRGCRPSYSVVSATGLAKDINFVYRNDQIEPNIDVSSIEFLENGYLRTKNGIYILPSLATDSIRRLELAEPESFMVVTFKNLENYLKSKYDAYDKRFYYKKGIIVNGTY